MSLVAESVAFEYGGRAVLAGVTLEIRPGEVVALVGPNGAGKSTVVKLLSGVLRPSQGEVRLDGSPLRGLSRQLAARRIAVAQQGGELPEGFTAADIVTMGRAPHLGLLENEGARDRAVVEAAMRQTEVWSLRGRRIWQLSGGEKQRVVLARALAQEPQYLLLDEPTTHLDLRFQVEILRHVRRQAALGLGILVVLHDLTLAARSCSRVVLLAGGTVEAEGPPSSVLTPTLLRRVYGVDVEWVGEGAAALLVPRI